MRNTFTHSFTVITLISEPHEPREELVEIIDLDAYALWDGVVCYDAISSSEATVIREAVWSLVMTLLPSEWSEDVARDTKHVVYASFSGSTLSVAAHMKFELWQHAD